MNIEIGRKIKEVKGKTNNPRQQTKMRCRKTMYKAMVFWKKQQKVARREWNTKT